MTIHQKLGCIDADTLWEIHRKIVATSCEFWYHSFMKRIVSNEKIQTHVLYSQKMEGYKNNSIEMRKQIVALKKKFHVQVSHSKK